MRGEWGDRRCLMRGAGLAAGVSLAALSAPGLAQDSTTLPEIRVIAPAPVSTPRIVVQPTDRPAGPLTRDPTVIDRDKVPSNTQTLTASDFERTYTPSVTEALTQRVPGVTTTDVQGNGFTQDLRYRGFAASPLQGT